MAGLQVALLALLNIRMLAFDYGSANASRHPLSNRQLAIMTPRKAEDLRANASVAVQVLRR